MKFNKKVLVALATILTLTVVFVLAFGFYQEKKLTDELNGYSVNFDKAIERQEKIKIMRDFKVNKEKFSNISEEYSKVEKEFKEWIVSDYNESIEEHNLAKLNEVEDKKAINDCKDNLNKLCKQIENENILNEDESNKLLNKIEIILKSYEKRLEEIAEAEKKAEEERIAKEKEEAERKAAEEAAKKQQAQNNSNKNNNSGGSNQTQSQSSSKPYLVKHNWHYDLETGEKIPGSETYIYSDGSVYDENGNYLCNVIDAGWGFAY